MACASVLMACGQRYVVVGLFWGAYTESMKLSEKRGDCVGRLVSETVLAAFLHDSILGGVGSSSTVAPLGISAGPGRSRVAGR